MRGNWGEEKNGLCAVSLAKEPGGKRVEGKKVYVDTGKGNHEHELFLERRGGVGKTLLLRAKGAEGTRQIIHSEKKGVISTLYCKGGGRKGKGGQTQS